MSKSKPKYPRDKYVKLPFLNPQRSKNETKVIVEQPRTVMNEAYEMMMRKWKAFNPEIIESALRLAMTRREEIRQHGFLAMTKALSKSAIAQRQAVDKPSDNLEKEKTLMDKKAMWNKARFLALMRAKRGTRKWAVTKNKIEKRTKKKNSDSFWFQAKKIVFPDAKKKVIKLQ